MPRYPVAEEIPPGHTDYLVELMGFEPRCSHGPFANVLSPHEELRELYAAVATGSYGAIDRLIFSFAGFRERVAPARTGLRAWIDTAIINLRTMGFLLFIFGRRA
jgi:hypothetical protein